MPHGAPRHAGQGPRVICHPINRRGRHRRETATSLSVVFDAHSQTVCGFCFKPDTTDKKTIKLVKRTGKLGCVFADDEHGAAWSRG